MAQTITIEVGDDKKITVSVMEDGKPAGEPLVCKDTAECAKFVDGVLNEEVDESAQEQGSEPAEDYSTVWNDEASKRKPQPGLIG